MAYNSLSVTGYRPYLINNNGGFVKKKEDEETSQASHSQQAENEQQQPKVVIKEKKKSIHEQIAESKENHRLAVESRDANLKNATINIAQILKDFRNTIKAIGASDELAQEANSYLELVEKQASKENPDSKLVRSNLKNASTLLDNYISETLQRPSKVVENWIEALFLQQINYKFDEAEINPHFLVKFPGGTAEEDEEKSRVENNEESTESGIKASEKPSVFIPSDSKLKSLFIQGKKYAYANDSKKAMEIFQEALQRALEINDSETESKIMFEVGKIYDKNDYLAQALTSYNKSVEKTTDANVKTQAYYSMAQIYDDVAQFEPAINHYMSSISFAGESDNLIAQSTSLTKIGNIFTDKYDKEGFDFLEEAELLANETNNSKAKAYVSSNIANAYNKLNEPQNALKYYSNAVKEYQNIGDAKKTALNYKRAAEVMSDYDNPSKAKSLLKKALYTARQTDDVQLMKEIHEALKM